MLPTRRRYRRSRIASHPAWGESDRWLDCLVGFVTERLGRAAPLV